MALSLRHFIEKARPLLPQCALPLLPSSHLAERLLSVPLLYQPPPTRPTAVSSPAVLLVHRHRPRAVPRLQVAGRQALPQSTTAEPPRRAHHGWATPTVFRSSHRLLEHRPRATPLPDRSGAAIDHRPDPSPTVRHRSTTITIVCPSGELPPSLLPQIELPACRSRSRHCPDPPRCRPPPKSTGRHRLRAMGSLPCFWPWALEAVLGGWASIVGLAHVHSVIFFFFK
jgi:hypothetical protein